MNRHNGTDKDKDHADPRLRGALETDQKARREAENGLMCCSSSECGGLIAAKFNSLLKAAIS
jgi:hypothetical protein